MSNYYDAAEQAADYELNAEYHTATPGEAHAEWHLNAGVPMGTPGCPQDACHPVDDDEEEYGPQDLHCLDEYQGGCSGSVEYRMALSGTGRPFPRCDKHWSDRLDTQDRLNRDYPDSPIPPAWFDPTYAGETWDDSEENIPF